MNKVNYDSVMRRQAEENRGKKLLLHCCCAPCSTACLERLKDYFEIYALFYNPNLGDEEYERRKAELVKLIQTTGWAKIIDCDRESERFAEAAKGLENQPEGGARCVKCFELRIGKTAETADEYGFDFFGTTLTVSPLKNAELINAIGERCAKKAKWLYSDFKKADGYLESVKLSKQYGLYRQNFCGCEFSRRR